VWPERDADRPSPLSVGAQNPRRLASTCTKNKNAYYLFDVSPLSFVPCVNLTVQYLATGWKFRGSSSGRGKFLFFRNIITCMKNSKLPSSVGNGILCWW